MEYYILFLNSLPKNTSGDLSNLNMEVYQHSIFWNSFEWQVSHYSNYS